MLRLDDIEVGYGGAAALTGVSLHVDAGELVCVIGPNGAGKTTLVNAAARLLPFRRGAMTLNGVDVTRCNARTVADLGVAIIPEGRRLFEGMTVEENLEMGCYRRGVRSWRKTGLAAMYEMFPILGERRRQVATTMSGGQQQMVAIARALMARPSLLLIDEPSLGLAPIIVTEVFDTIKRVHANGMSILLIEQNATRALEIAQRAYVIEGGRMVAEGDASQMQSAAISQAYLGVGG